ncbi:hypothetical protein [Methylocystis sp.]|uniref:hypothetical protein n=1 Tax=Methylocystis sp. TaxID=1911079 RepID=UPI003DA3E8F0
MTTVMTPSTITSGQIGKAQELLEARLRKSGFPSAAVQQVLEMQGDVLAAEWLAAIQKRVDAISDMIVRCVRVNRSRSPQEALAATGRKQYVTDAVVADMPRGDGDEAEIFFFKVGRWISDDDLEKEYSSRGLVPADPFSLAAVNEVDATFADDHPNGTHWKDADGKWCFATFYRWSDDERSVSVGRGVSGWLGSWWFAGRRK